MSKTTIASFVVRFTQEVSSDAERVLPWRAVIRHVQSDEEVHFTTMAEALAFVGQYVDLTSGSVGDEGAFQIRHSQESGRPRGRSDEESHPFGG